MNIELLMQPEQWCHRKTAAISKYTEKFLKKQISYLITERDLMGKINTSMELYISLLELCARSLDVKDRMLRSVSVLNVSTAVISNARMSFAVLSLSQRTLSVAHTMFSNSLSSRFKRRTQYLRSTFKIIQTKRELS